MDPVLKRTFKARLFGEFARIGKALASPHRLHLNELLARARGPSERRPQRRGG
jgi:hypothetical protein